MHILVTRPEPGASETREALEALGHRVTVAPVLTVEIDPEAAIDLDGVAALVATSRNGLRALTGISRSGETLALPFFAVGPGTARAARDAGFVNVIEGAGAAAQLAAVIAKRVPAEAGVILHLAGEDRAYDLAGDLSAKGYRVRAPVLYRTVAACSFSRQVEALLRDGSLDAVILMSPRTAEVFTGLLHRSGLADAARRLVFLCLSKGVAARLAELGSVTTAVADRPEHAALLDLVARLEAART